MKNINKDLLIHIAIATALFAVSLVIFNNSIPKRFNLKPENRKYFDSDGEFITRQFREGKTFTHNDHILYHVMGKFLFDHSPAVGIKQNYVTPHKVLSVFFGALGVMLFYVFGAMITKRQILPLVCALFAGGTAGWWFFSATIDTYIPCLSVSIPVLGCAVLCLKKESYAYSIAIGAMAGLAFLFRTDSFILMFMGIYLLKIRGNGGNHLLSVIIPGVIIGIAGYVILAHVCYGVDFNPVNMFKWAMGSLQRPEAVQEKIWGKPENITPYNGALLFVNQLMYTIVIPGLMKTRGADFYMRYVKGGWIPLIIYMSALAVAIYHITMRVKKNSSNDNKLPLYIVLLSATWFVTRWIFYTWWDPFDPFLFAGMAMPAIWLTLLTGFHYALETSATRKIEQGYWLLIGTATLAVWLHNIYYMIGPLRKSCL